MKFGGPSLIGRKQIYMSYVDGIHANFIIIIKKVLFLLLGYVSRTGSLITK